VEVIVSDDKLEGATSIATFLGWKERKVYQAREQGWTVPIRKRDGVGLYAFKSELEAWLRDDTTLPVRPGKAA
jgi:hypothetical protein